MLDQIKNLREQPHAVVWILLALFGVVLLLQIVQLAQTGDSEAPLEGDAQRGAEITDYDASAILQRQLFGSGAASSPVANQTSQTPVTNLALTLQAIFSAPNADNSNAIIAGPDGSAKNYRVGAALADNATVERIDANQVVIKRDGKLETLRFPRPGTAAAQAARSQQDELSKQDYSQLLSSLSSKDRKKAMAKLQSGGDMRSLLQALPPEQKLKVVRKRLEQLRQQSSSKKK
ncbi:MAG: type II secretion system protein N [Pseudomonadales bacterium]